METFVTDSPEEAARYIRQGGIVAFPTETVYGLGAGIFNETAIMNVFEAKRRPNDNPLIAHIGSLRQIGQLAAEVTPAADALVRAFFPGPLTIVLPKAEGVPLCATAGLDTIGIRMPDHPPATEFIDKCGWPLVAPSANLSGKPSPTTWQAVYEDLKDKIDCILKGRPTRIGLESTVIDCTADPPVILRAGAVCLEQIAAVVPGIIRGTADRTKPASPGLRHRHYSPSATVVLTDDPEALRGGTDSAYIGLTRPGAAFAELEVCETETEYARRLFDFFRRCDRSRISRIYCEKVDENGIGAALMDRVRRASTDRSPR